MSKTMINIIITTATVTTATITATTITITIRTYGNGQKRMTCIMSFRSGN